MTDREFHRGVGEVALAVALAVVCWTWGFMTHVSWCRAHHVATDRYHQTEECK